MLNAIDTTTAQPTNVPVTSVVRRLEDAHIEPPKLVAPDKSMIHVAYGYLGRSLMESLAEVTRRELSLQGMNAWEIAERLGVQVKSGPLKWDVDTFNVLIERDASYRTTVMVDSSRVGRDLRESESVRRALGEAIGQAVLVQAGITGAVGFGDLVTRLGQLVCVGDDDVASTVGVAVRIPFGETPAEHEANCPTMTAARDALATRFSLDRSSAWSRLEMWLEKQLGDLDIFEPELELTDEMIAQEVGEPFYLYHRDADDGGASDERLERHVSALIALTNARDGGDEARDCTIEWLDIQFGHCASVFAPGQEYGGGAVPPPSDPWAATRPPAIREAIRGLLADVTSDDDEECARACCGDAISPAVPLSYDALGDSLHEIVASCLYVRLLDESVRNALSDGDRGNVIRVIAKEFEGYWLLLPDEKLSPENLESIQLRRAREAVTA